MKNIPIYVVGAVALLGVVLGIHDGADTEVVRETVREVITESAPLGALSGPDIPSNWLRWGGVLDYRQSLTMKTATTTLCAIQNPGGATTTIQHIGFQITTGTSTAAAITIATSTSQYATSTADALVLDRSVGADTEATVTWAPSSDDNILAPGLWVLVKTAGAGAGGYTYTGTCNALFIDP